MIIQALNILISLNYLLINLITLINFGHVALILLKGMLTSINEKNTTCTKVKLFRSKFLLRVRYANTKILGGWRKI